jgi:hypothetical protein
MKKKKRQVKVRAIARFFFLQNIARRMEDALVRTQACSRRISLYFPLDRLSTINSTATTCLPPF